MGSLQHDFMLYAPSSLFPGHVKMCGECLEILIRYYSAYLLRSDAISEFDV